MAVTRIKSNQITDLAVTNAKLADYSIQGGKLANSFTYGSDFTVSGNLTVNGTTTTVDTVTTTIDDPILLLGSNQTGAGSVDLGILGERGDDTNVFMGYDESADEFVMALTSTSDSNSAVTITDYVTTHVGGLTIDDNATVGGTMTATGNVTGGNLVTGGAVQATGAISTSSGDFNGVNINLTGDAYLNNVRAYEGVDIGAFGGGNVQISNVGVLTSSGASSTFSGNVSVGGTLDVTGAMTASSTITATGNVTGGNLVTAGRVDGANIQSTGEVGGSSLVSLGTTYSVGNITGGNLITAGLVSATGNVTGGNLTTAGLVSAYNATLTNDLTVSGNVSVADVSASGELSVSGEATLASATVSDLTSGRVVIAGTSGALEDSTNLTFDGSTLTLGNGAISVNGTATVVGNITGGNLVTTGKADIFNLEADNIQITSSNASIDFNSQTVGNVGTPTASSDAATKGYVDNLLSSGFTMTDGTTSQTIAQGDTLTFSGTTNEIEVTVGNVDTVTIGLPSDVEITNNLTIGGNLIVQGSQTIVDATSTSIVDPILQLGRGANNAALTANDGKDRGVAMYYYNGSEKVAYLGWDDPSNEFRFIPDATISSEAVTGSLGTANLGKVRVDAIDIDSNSITTTSGNLELSAAGASHVKVPTGNELVIEDISDTHIVYSNSGQLEGGAGLTYDGTEFYADNMYSGGYLNVAGTANVANLEVSGTSSLAGAVTAYSTLGVSGATTLSSTLNVSGTGTFAGDLNVTGDATIGNVTVSGTADFAGINATGNVTGGNLTTAGDVTTATVTASSTITATGNVTGGNLITTGLVSSSNLTAGEATIGNDLSVSGNATVSGSLGVTGEATLASATVSDLTSGRVVLAGASGSLNDSANMTFDGFDLTLGDGGLSVGTTVTATGNITGGNLITTGLVSSSNLTAGEATIGNDLSVSGNASVNGTLTVTGASTMGNITVDGNDITASTGGEVVINEAGADVNFRVEGDTNTALFVVDAGLNKIGLGGAPTAGNCTVCIESTDALKLPVGTTAQRPTGAAGMIRYNSSTDQVEGWDVSEGQFKALGVPAFTVIASETFDGDGTTTAFTLGSDQTTQSCIVSINGVVQLPTSAYAVSGNVMTFTEAPETGDKIEVRQITTTTTVASLSNGDQSVTIECADSQVEITGDVVVTGNLTFSGQNFLGQYNHSNVYVATSTDATNNTGSTLAITAATLGFNLTQASYYQVFLNRQLLRPSEVTVNLTNGTLTFASDTLAANDEIEAVFLAT